MKTFPNIYRAALAIKVISLLVFLQLFGCKDGQDQIPDTSDIEVENKIIRFEEHLFKADTNHLGEVLSELKSRYTSFYNLYFSQIIALSNKPDAIEPMFIKELKEFLGDAEIRRLYELVEKQFGDKSFPEKEFRKSLQLMKYYFPDESEPIFYTLISGFTYGNFIFGETQNRDGIGIGLEFFLGDQFNYQTVDPDNPAFSSYLSRTFNRDHLLKKTWEVWLEDRIPEPANGSLLDYMIQRGKKLYVLEKLLPWVHDTVLFEYTDRQLEWAHKNRLEMWNFFLDGNLLYSTELIKFGKFIRPAPNSPGMPPEAPGQTGNYIGYQIIKSFIKRNPAVDLKQLLAMNDNQELLKKARFKPRND